MSDDTTPATHEVRLSSGESRRAFVLNVLNGGLYSFADSLMDANLVLVWFASQLTTSNLLLGLIAPINSGAWYLPQLFLSGRVQAMPRQIVLYRWMTVVRFSTWVLLAAALWWLRAPLLLLGAFYALYTITRLASGAAGIPYLEVTAKTIPSRQRGRMFALRQLTAGLLALIGTRVIRRVLSGPLPYPRNYALLVFLAALVGGVALTAFAITREPPGATRAAASLREQVRRGVQTFRTDSDYRNLLLGRSLLFLGMIVVPFYSLLAKQVLGAPERAVADYLLVVTFTKLLVTFPWGWLADHWGNRWVLRVAALGWSGMNGVAIVLALAASAGWLARLPFPPYLAAYPLFFLVGLLTPMEGIAGQSLLLALVPEHDRALYLGFANTVLGAMLLLSALGGGLVDLLGLPLLFGTAIVVNLAAWGFLGRVRKM